MEFTDDGYVGFDMVDVDYVNQELPDPLDPNNVLAMFWDDFVIQYDAATNKGVTMVGDSASFATIEYDDLYLWGGDTAVTLDVEVGYFLQPDDAPGAYEIVYAFDNIHPDLLAEATATIGLENVDGTAGNLISFNDPALSIEDGSAICFDWKYVPAEAHVITFQVTVDADVPGGPLTNVALHSNDQLGTVAEEAEAVVDILNNTAPVLDPIGPQSGDEDTLITFTATATDADLPVQVLTFSLTGTVPAGAVIDPTTGVFTWTPADPGEYTFTVQVCDDAVEPLCDSEEITVTVNLVEPDFFYLYLPLILK